MKTWKTVIAVLIGIMIGLPLSIYADETRPEQQDLMERPAPVIQEADIEELRQLNAQPDIRIQMTGPDRSDPQVDLLARLVYWEAGNQDATGKRLVADVVLNRVNDQSDTFPDNIVDVIYQDGQFSVTPLLYTEEPTEDCYEIVIEELTDQLDWEVKWFDCAGYLPFGTPAYQYGGHYFSK